MIIKYLDGFSENEVEQLLEVPLEKNKRYTLDVSIDFLYLEIYN
jgi:hypothetical protein